MSIWPSVNLWGVLSVFVVCSALVAGIIAAVLLYSKKIRESESRFRLLFDSVFDSIVLLDEDSTIIDVNRAFCSLLAFEKKELFRQRLETLVTREKWSALQSEFSKTLASGMGYIGETGLVTKRGRVVHVEIGTRAIRMNGEGYVLASFRDIGARIEAQNRLKSKNAALSELLTHIEEEKLKYKQQIATAIDDTIMPSLDKLLNPDGTVSIPQFDVLKSSLDELATSTGGLVYAFSKLTPREVEICNMVRAGKTSKYIAEALDISIATVSKHRERIRRKLVIASKEVNLTTFLRNT